MRRVVRLPAAPESCQLVEIAGMLFSSTITGVDPVTGRPDSDPGRQTHTAFQNLRQLLDAAGVSARELGLVRIAVSTASVGAALAEPWRAFFPDRDQPARRVDVYPLPEGQHVQLQVVGVRSASRQRLTGPGIGDSASEPPVIRIGDLVFSSALSGIDPRTRELVQDPHDQVRQAFRNMEAIVQQAGGTSDDIAHVFIYVRDLADNDDVLAAFLEAFPTDDNRTTRKNVYDDQLKGSPIVAQLQMIAVLGKGKRLNYEVPGAAKRHPNPLGTRLGNLLFSAGIGGHDPADNEVERQTARALRNVRALLEQAGGGLADLAHVTFTVDDYAHTPIIVDEWRKLFPDPADEPARHIMAYGGRDGNYQVQVHVVAVLGDAPPR
jgi:2-iminobutanoate/2-iminopropanoate deaminase